MLKYHSENSPQKLWLALSFGFQKIRYYCTASAILIKSNAWNDLKGGPRRHPPPVVSVLIDHYYDNSDTMVARATALILLVETQGGALRPSNIMHQGDEEG